MRVHNLDPSEAGAWLGITTGVGGIAGILLGGLVTQRLARTDPAQMLRVPALTSALAVPFEVLFLTLPAASAPMMNLAASFFDQQTRTLSHLRGSRVRSSACAELHRVLAIEAASASNLSSTRRSR
jgi:hypothetical protein